MFGEQRTDVWRRGSPRQSVDKVVIELADRAFTPEDAATDGDPVVIVSHRTWQTRLASRSPAIGRAIHLNGRTHTVIGVMPEPFWFESREIDVWFPRMRDGTSL
jgi:hypothetical protein